MCSEYIKSHIQQLPWRRIFTTRDVLQYGYRGAVDQALSRLVQDNVIVRLARGVFVRDRTYHPSLEVIAKAKMKSWKKLTFMHAQNLLVALKLFPQSKKAPSLFAVDSHSSSFDTVAGRVELKGIGARRVGLCETKVGQIAYALWHLTERVCTQDHVSLATANLKRSEREDFRTAAALMPAWLSDLCRFRFPIPRVVL